MRGDIIVDDTRRVARSNNRSHAAGATYDDMTIVPASSTGGDSLRSSLELSRSLAHAGSTRLIVLARQDVPYRVGREGRDEYGAKGVSAPSRTSVVTSSSARKEQADDVAVSSK